MGRRGPGAEGDTGVRCALVPVQHHSTQCFLGSSDTAHPFEHKHCATRKLERPSPRLTQSGPHSSPRSIESTAGLEESEQVIGGQVIVGSEPTLQFLSLSAVYETDSPGPHLGSVGITLSSGWGLIGHYCTLSRKPSWDLSPALPGLPPGCCS